MLVIVIAIAFVAVVLLTIIVVAATLRCTRGGKTPKVFCERRYINWAWGFQHTGFYIDDDGHVYEFDASVPRKNTTEESAQTFNALEQDHWGKKRALVKTLTPEELAQYRDMVRNATYENAGLGKQIGFANDAGRIMFDCYETTSGDGDAPLTKYPLRLDGDVQRESGGPQARALAQWLDDLAGTLHPSGTS